VSPLDGVPDVTAGLHQPKSNRVVGIELDADRSRNVCERVFDPRFVLCLGLPEAGGRAMLRGWSSIFLWSTRHNKIRFSYLSTMSGGHSP
jgi:hypothetical protein